MRQSIQVINRKNYYSLLLNGDRLIDFFERDVFFKNNKSNVKIDDKFVEALASFIEREENLFLTEEVFSDEVKEIEEIDLTGFFFEDEDKKEERKKHLIELIQKRFYRDEIFINQKEILSESREKIFDKEYYRYTGAKRNNENSNDKIIFRHFLFEASKISKHRNEELNEILTENFINDSSYIIESFLLFAKVKHKYVKKIFEGIKNRKGIVFNLEMLDLIEKELLSKVKMCEAYFSVRRFLSSFYKSLIFYFNAETLSIDKKEDSFLIEVFFNPKLNGNVNNAGEILKSKYIFPKNYIEFRKKYEKIKQLNDKNLNYSIEKILNLEGFLNSLQNREITSLDYMIADLIVSVYILHLYKTFVGKLEKRNIEIIEEVEKEFLRIYEKIRLEEIFAKVLAFIFVCLDDGQEEFKTILDNYKNYIDFIVSVSLKDKTLKGVYSVIKEQRIDEVKTKHSFNIESIYENIKNIFIKEGKGKIFKKYLEENIKNPMLKKIRVINSLKEKETIEIIKEAFNSLEPQRAYVSYKVDGKKEIFVTESEEKTLEGYEKIIISFKKRTTFCDLTDERLIREKLFIREDENVELCVFNIGKEFKIRINDNFIIPKGKDYLVNILDNSVIDIESNTGKKIILIIALISYILLERRAKENKRIGILTLFADEEKDKAVDFYKTLMNDVSFLIPIYTKGLVKKKDAIEFRFRQSLFSLNMPFAYKEVEFDIREYEYLKKFFYESEISKLYEKEEFAKKGIAVFNHMVSFFTKEKISYYRENSNKEYLIRETSRENIAFIESFISFVKKKKDNTFVFQRFPISKFYHSLSKDDSEKIARGQSEYIENFVSSIERTLKEELLERFPQKAEELIKRIEEIPYTNLKIKPTLAFNKILIKKNFSLYEGITNKKNKELFRYYVSTINKIKGELSPSLKEKSLKKSDSVRMKKNSYFIPKFPKPLAKDKKLFLRNIIFIEYPEKGEMFFLEDIDRLIILADGSRKSIASKDFVFSLSYIGDLHKNSFSREYGIEYDLNGKNARKAIIYPLFGEIASDLKQPETEMKNG